jgi:hypothetical protein
MKKYTEFDEFYSVCISIIKNNIQYLDNLLNRQKIKFIRENIDKNILNSYHSIGVIPKDVANAIGSKTRIVKFSIDNMIKNLLEHSEITIEEYKNINLYIKNAEYILKKNNKNLIYFKIDNKIYQFVIKSTKMGDELFLTTFHKASVKQLTKDIYRYLPIKKDSSDYEDSKYPSVT